MRRRNGDVKTLGTKVEEMTDRITKQLRTQGLNQSADTIDIWNALEARIERLEAENVRLDETLKGSFVKIERLEAALQKIAKDETGDWDYVCYIASAALEGK